MNLLDDTIRLMRTPLRSDDMRSLLNAWGMTYPKKDTVSPNDTITIIKDAGKTVCLGFDLDARNPNFPPVCGQRKNSYIPVLTELEFLQGREDILPLGFRHGDRRDDLIARHGPAHRASKNLNAQGQPTGEYWHFPAGDKRQQLEYMVIWNSDYKDIGKSTLCLRIASRRPLWFLQDFCEQRETVVAASQDPFVVLGLFVEWTIAQKWMTKRENPAEQQAAEQVRAGVLSGPDYLRRHWQDCRLWAEDFDAEREFVARYLNNLPPLYQSLRKDYQEQLALMFGPVPLEQEDARMATIVENPALREAMFSIFERRLNEYRAYMAAAQADKIPL